MLHQCCKLPSQSHNALDQLLLTAGSSSIVHNLNLILLRIHC